MYFLFSNLRVGTVPACRIRLLYLGWANFISPPPPRQVLDPDARKNVKIRIKLNFSDPDASIRAVLFYFNVSTKFLNPAGVYFWTKRLMVTTLF